MRLARRRVRGLALALVLVLVLVLAGCSDPDVRFAKELSNDERAAATAAIAQAFAGDAGIVSVDGKPVAHESLLSIDRFARSPNPLDRTVTYYVTVRSVPVDAAARGLAAHAALRCSNAGGEADLVAWSGSGLYQERVTVAPGGTVTNAATCPHHP